MVAPQTPLWAFSEKLRSRRLPLQIKEFIALLKCNSFFFSFSSIKVHILINILKHTH